jgi:hypothetical protein
MKRTKESSDISCSDFRSWSSAAMMATQAEIKQRNLESSILYLQQEHSNTLKGLHEEIQQLQKKNSGMNLQS